MPFPTKLFQLFGSLLRFSTRRSSLPARYITSAPSPQNALDIFKGEWWCRLPPPFDGLRAGDLQIFDDARITWALSQWSDIDGQKILELGPLEGAHAYMFEQAGAGSVVSIEANPRAYLKCLIVKEILGLARTQFLCGDFIEYLRNSPPPFDAVCASGVLYHMTAPLELLNLISQVTDQIFLWTHYYDAELVGKNRTLARRFTAEFESEMGGFRHRLFRYQYRGSFATRRFCGGSRPYAHWMRRDDIIACLKQLGFDTIQIAFELPDHPDGPSFALVATREK